MVTSIEDSILDSVKQITTGSDDSSFDVDLKIFINGVLAILNQLGVGPIGFTIKDREATWDQLFEGRKDLEHAKTFVLLKVRLAFDPPQNSFLVDAIKAQIAELEWRLEQSSRNPEDMI